MKVITLGQPLFFDCVPRNYPEAGDALSLHLRDENNKEIFTTNITWMIQEKLRIEFTSQPEQFSSRSKFEIELKNDDKTIYKGKLIVVDAGTDIQNYSNEKQSNSKFIFND